MKSVYVSWTNSLLSWRANNRSRICPQCIFAPVVRSMAAGLLTLSALYFAVSRRRLSAEQSTAAEDGLREDMILSLLPLRPCRSDSAAVQVKAVKQK